MKKDKQIYELLIQLLDSTSDLIMICDTSDINNFPIVYVNKLMAESFGMKKNQLLGKNFWTMIPDHVAKIRKEQALKVIQTKKAVLFEDERFGRSFLNHYIPIFDENHEVVYGATITEEITDIKKTERDYQQLVDNMAEGVLTLDKTGRFTYINKIIEKRTGFTKEEFYKLKFTDIILPEFKEQAKKQFKKIFNGEEVESFEVDYYSKNGNIITVEISANPIYKEDKIIGVQCLTLDVTERNKTQRQLRESEKKLRDIIFHSDDLFYIHDCNHRVQYVSHQSKKIFGYSEDEMKTKWTNLTTNNPINEKGFELTNKAIQTGIKQEPYILEAIRKDGKKIIVKINESPIKDDRGKVVGVTGVLIDVTKQILAEKRLKESEQEMKKGREYLQNVIDSASEIIFTTSSNNIIKTWNLTAEFISGFKKNQVVGKKLNCYDLFANSERICNFISNISKGNEDQLEEIIINTIDHEKKILRVSPSFIKEKKGTVTEILFICKDITIEKEAHGQLFKGNSYLITDQSDNKMDIFISLLDSEYTGLYIGRTSKENMQSLFRTSHPHFINLLSEQFSLTGGISHLDELYKEIEEFLIDPENNNSIILLDRLDYLITIHSFETVIKWLYNINELVIKYKAIFFLCINPDIFNETQLEFIQMEFEQLPSQSIGEISLDETQYEILKFINYENNQNVLINYRDVGKRFNISKVTVKKRLDSLRKLDLIYSQKYGRSKYIHITMKGKNILSHRETI